MKTLYLLIILTQNGAGDINASFVNAESLEQCQQKMLMVESIFTVSSIPVIESRCIKSEMQFSEFGHALASSKIRNFYSVHLDKAAVKITQMPDWDACMEQQKIGVKQGKVYCSSSVQSIQ